MQRGTINLINNFPFEVYIFVWVAWNGKEFHVAKIFLQHYGFKISVLTSKHNSSVLVKRIKKTILNGNHPKSSQNSFICLLIHSNNFLSGSYALGIELDLEIQIWICLWSAQSDNGTGPPAGEVFKAKTFRTDQRAEKEVAGRSPR